MKKFALLVGINYPGTSNELRGCCNDVQTLKAILIGEGYNEKSIRILTDDKDCCFRPSKQNILDGLDWLVRMSHKHEGCQLFFSYSGHGVQLKGEQFKTSGPNDETDGYDEAICPGDGGYISDDELHEVFVKGLNSTAKAFVILDCCHSGSGLDLKFSTDGKYLYDEAIGRSGRKADVQMISGCRDDQTSADAYDKIDKQSEGAMTDAFDKAYRACGVGPIGAVEFLRMMTQILIEGGYEQRPRFSSTRRITMNTILQMPKTNQATGGRGMFLTDLVDTPVADATQQSYVQVNAPQRVPQQLNSQRGTQQYRPQTQRGYTQVHQVFPQPVYQAQRGSMSYPRNYPVPHHRIPVYTPRYYQNPVQATMC